MLHRTGTDTAYMHLLNWVFPLRMRRTSHAYCILTPLVFWLRGEAEARIVLDQRCSQDPLTVTPRWCSTIRPMQTSPLQTAVCCTQSLPMSGHWPLFACARLMHFSSCTARGCPRSLECTFSSYRCCIPSSFGRSVKIYQHRIESKLFDTSIFRRFPLITIIQGILEPRTPLSTS